MNVSQPCDTIQRVMKLSSSAFNWYLPNHHSSFVKAYVKPSSWRMWVLYATVRPDMQGNPPSTCVVAAQSKFRRSKYRAPKKPQIRCEKVGETARRNRWQVTTPPYLSSFSKGARIQGSTVRGQLTSSSANTVMAVRTSGIALVIWRRLLGWVTVKRRILDLEAGIWLSIFSAFFLFASIVTSRSSYGWLSRIVLIVSTSSSPHPSNVGRITVTSCAVSFGFSGGGIGLKVQNETRLTTRRK